MNYLIGIDRGNSGIRAGLYDDQGHYICGANVDIELVHPLPGYNVCPEGTLKEGLFRVLKKMTEAVPEGVGLSDVKGISFSMAGGMITGFTEDGRMPLETVFAGDCRRNDVFKATPLLEAAGISDEEYAKEASTTPPWILSDILCLKESEPEKTRDIKYWTITEHALVLRYLGSDRFVDPECGGSMHYNYNPFTHSYVPKICDAVGIYGKDWLPMVYAGEPMGTLGKEAAEATGLKEGTPLFSGTNDMIPIVIAMGAVNEEEAISNYGTFGTIGKRMDRPFDFKPNISSIHSLHVTGGGFENDWQIGAIVSGCCASYSGPNRLCGEFSGDTEKKWYDELNAMAERSDIGANGVVYSPFIIDGKASFSHLNIQTKLSDMVRAVMEGIAYEMLVSLQEVEESIDVRIRSLYVSGGLTKSDVFNHILADMYGIEIAKASVNQDMVGTKGPAMIAGIGAGLFRDVRDAVDHMVEKNNEIVLPNEENHLRYRELIKTWK